MNRIWQSLPESARTALVGLIKSMDIEDLG